MPGRQFTDRPNQGVHISPDQPYNLLTKQKAFRLVDGNFRLALVISAHQLHLTPADSSGSVHLFDSIKDSLVNLDAMLGKLSRKRIDLPDADRRT
jgi:hypothetical protein